MRVSSAKNPVPNLLCALATREPPLGLTGRVLNARFMESPFLDLRRAPRFFASGFCQPPCPRVPGVSASVSSKEACDPPSVESTDHQSYLAGHPSRFPLDRMCQSVLSSQLSAGQLFLYCSTPVTRDGFLYFFIGSGPAPLPYPSIGDIRFPFRMTAVSCCARPSETLQ